MSLFKISKGLKADLPTIYHEGYIYFTTDTKEFFIDIDSSEDFTTGTRVQVNSDSATKLQTWLADGSVDKTIQISDIALIDNVYSKTETDSKIAETSTVQYEVTLTANGWTQSGENYIYDYSNPNLVAKVAPIISPTNNEDEYSNIVDANATPGTGIIFTTTTKPTNDIGIIIIDVK